MAFLNCVREWSIVLRTAAQRGGSARILHNELPSTSTFCGIRRVVTASEHRGPVAAEAKFREKPDSAALPPQSDAYRSYRFGPGRRRGRSTGDMQPSRRETFMNYDAGSAGQLSFENQLSQSLFYLSNDLKRMGRSTRGKVESILSMIGPNDRLTSADVLNLIRACGAVMAEELPNERTKLVNHFVAQIKNRGFPFDISHYNALLLVYLENGHKFSPSDMLKELNSNNVQPNRVTYLRLIERFCRIGDVDQASQILQRMKESDMPVNEFVFHSLISGYLRVGEKETAEKLIEMMKSSGLQISADTHVAKAIAYAEKGDINTVLQLIQEGEKDEVRFSDENLMNLVVAAADLGKASLEDLSKLIELMPKNIGFNYLAYNNSLKLVNAGQLDAAWLVLNAMENSVGPDGRTKDNGNFILRHIVRCGMPFESLISFCKRLKESGKHEDPLLSALFNLYAYKKLDDSIKLIRIYKDEGHEVRPNFIFPIAAMFAQQRPEDFVQMFELFQRCDMFGRLPIQLYGDFIFTNAPQLRIEPVMHAAVDRGFAAGPVINGFLSTALLSGNVEKVRAIMQMFRPRVFRSNYLNPYIVDCYRSTQDLDVLPKLVRYLQESSQKREIDEDHEDEKEKEDDREDSLFMINFLRNMCLVSRNDIDSLVRFFNALADVGVHVPKEEIENHIFVRYFKRDTIDEQLKAALLKLSTVHPEEVPLNKLVQYRGVSEGRPADDALTRRSLQSYGKTLERIKSEGQKPSENFLMNYLRACLEEENVERAENVLKEVEAHGYKLKSSLRARMISCYVKQKNLSKALEQKTLIEASGDRLNFFKMLQIFGLLIEQNKVEEVLEGLKSYMAGGSPLNNTQDEKRYIMNIKELLSIPAAKGDVDATKKLTNTIFELGYARPQPSLLIPILNAYFAKNDLDGALKEFFEILTQHKIAPYTEVLFKELLEKDRQEDLKNMFTECSKLHGEMVTLAKLAFGAISAGQPKRAEKIFTRRGFTFTNDLLEFRCNNMATNGKTGELEALLEATKQLKNIDRDRIFRCLIQAYRKKSDWRGAINAWHRMQEEDIMASNSTLRLLAATLQEHNEPVPFQVPNEQDVGESKKSTDHILLCQRLLNDKKYSEALQILRDSRAHLDNNMYSRIVHKLLEENQLQDAINAIELLARRGIYLRNTTLRFAYLKLSESGDSETLNRLRSAFPKKLLEASNFDNYYNRSLATRGDPEYLKLTTPGVGVTKMHSRDLIRYIEKDPNCESKVVELANTTSPVPIQLCRGLWTYFMLKGDLAKANNMKEKLGKLRGGDVALFAELAKEQMKEDSLRKFVAEESDIELKGIAFSYVLGIKLERNDLDGAAKVVEEAAEMGVTTEFMRHRMLRLLEVKLTAVGKAVNFQVPEQSRRQRKRSQSKTDEKAEEGAEKSESPAEDSVKNSQTKQ